MNDWHQAELHAERAHRFYEAGEWERALAELRLALEYDPDQSDWHFGAGLALEALARFPEAVRSFQEVVRLRGPDRDALLHLGVDLIRVHKYRRAVEVLERLEQLDPECEASYCHRILAYARLGHHDLAEQMFYLARQVVEECPHCYDRLAQSLVARGEVRRATWCWEQAIRLDPRHPDAYVHLARAQWRLGDAARAEQLLRQHLRESPSDTDALLLLGSLLMDLGRHAESADKFRRALEADPLLAPAHQRLGELAYVTGHFEAAVVALETADRIDPQRTGIHLCLAHIARKQGRRESARSHLRTELDRTGHSPAQVLEMARLLIELQMPQPAAQILGVLLADRDLESARRSSALHLRGVARMLLGKRTLGIRDFRRAITLTPDQPAILQNLALAHLESGRLQRAEHWLGRALALRPGEADLLRLRRRLRRAKLGAAWRDLRRRCAGTLRRWFGRPQPSRPRPAKAASPRP